MVSQGIHISLPSFYKAFAVGCRRKKEAAFCCYNFIPFSQLSKSIAVDRRKQAGVGEDVMRSTRARSFQAFPLMLACSLLDVEWLGHTHLIALLSPPLPSGQENTHKKGSR